MNNKHLQYSLGRSSTVHCAHGIWSARLSIIISSRANHSGTSFSFIIIQDPSFFLTFQSCVHFLPYPLFRNPVPSLTCTKKFFFFLTLHSRTPFLPYLPFRNLLSSSPSTYEPLSSSSSTQEPIFFLTFHSRVPFSFLFSTQILFSSSLCVCGGPLESAASVQLLRLSLQVPGDCRNS